MGEKFRAAGVISFPSRQIFRLIERKAHGDKVAEKWVDERRHFLGVKGASGSGSGKS